MSSRKTAVVVGLLFLTSTATFIVGSSLVTSFVEGDRRRGPLTAGVLLEVYTGAAVAAIGLLMYPVLKHVNARLALGYAAFRIVECAVIVGCGIYLLARLKLVGDYDLIVYVFTGIGGLIFAYLLYRSKIVPRLLSVLGLVGYATLLAGIPAEAIGDIDLDRGLGSLFYVPGGLFELVLPVWLIARGFRPPETELLKGEKP